MNFDIDDGLSPIRGKRNRTQDKYATSRRSMSNSSRENRSNRDYRLSSDSADEDIYEPTQYGLPEDYVYGDEAYGDEYFDEARRNRRNSSNQSYHDEDYTPPYGQRDRSYKPRNYTQPYGQPDRMPTFRGGNENIPPVPREYSRSYEDEGYEDYGEIGSNFSPSDDPSWGYDNPERYNYDYSSGGGENNADNDLKRYMEYIDKYDNGEIDNHDMSRVQRRFANSSFWDTFSPSEKMIREYGSGNESTKWPLFERKDGRWKPINWRND